MHGSLQALTQLGNTGQDVDVAVHHADGDPEVFLDEEELLVHVAARVRRDLDHPQLGRLGRRLLVPVEVGLRRVRPREPLHALVRALVQDERQPKRLGYRLVRDVVVSAPAGNVREGKEASQAGSIDISSQ